MTDPTAGIEVPDTALTRAATELVRQATSDSPVGEVIFHHSRRVFFFGMLKSTALGLDVDAELAYVAAMCHDLGLTPSHRRTDQRFEIDSADAAHALLLEHGQSDSQARTVWLAIALHTTPEVPAHLEPEIGVVTRGVEADVLGLDLDLIADDDLDAVLHAHPRTDFKQGILQGFYDGMAQRPDTTFGTMNDDVLAHFDPSFTRDDFVRMIHTNPLPG